jgi:hypothetical protein
MLANFFIASTPPRPVSAVRRAAGVALAPLATLLLLAGCATAEPGSFPERQTTTFTPPTNTKGSAGTPLRTGAESGPRTVRVGASAEAVWEALERAYEALDIPVEIRDPAARRMGNPGFVRIRQLSGRPLSTYLGCGQDVAGNSIADTHRIQVAVLAEVIPRGEESDVTILVRGVALPGASTTARVACMSTGALEQRLGNTMMLQFAG